MKIKKALIYTILAGVTLASCKPKMGKDSELPKPSVATFEMVRYTDPNFPADMNTYIFRNTTDGAFISSWDFGGTQKSSAAVDTIFFANKGTYTIKLTTSSRGGTTTVSQDLVISETSPYLADFTIEPVSGKTNTYRLAVTNVGLISQTFKYPNGDSSKAMVDTVYFPFSGTFDISLFIKTVKGPSSTVKQISIAGDDPANPYLNDQVMTMLTGGSSDPDGKTWVQDVSSGAGGVGSPNSNTTDWYTMPGYTGPAWENGMAQNSFTFKFRDYQFIPKNNMATVHFSYANMYFGQNQAQWQDIALPDPNMKQAPFILRKVNASMYPFSWPGYVIDMTNLSYLGYNEQHPSKPQYRYRYEIISITDTKMVIRHRYSDNASDPAGSEAGFRYFTLLAQ